MYGPSTSYRCRSLAADAGRRDLDDRVGGLLRSSDRERCPRVRRAFHARSEPSLRRRYPGWVGPTDEWKWWSRERRGTSARASLQALARGRARGGDRRDRAPDAGLAAAEGRAGSSADVARDDLVAALRGRRRRHPPRLADPAEPRRRASSQRVNVNGSRRVFEAARGPASRRSSTPPRSASTRPARRIVPSTSRGRAKASSRSSTRATRPSAERMLDGLEGRGSRSCGCGRG